MTFNFANSALSSSTASSDVLFTFLNQDRSTEGPLMWRPSGLPCLSSRPSYDDMQLHVQPETSPTTSSPATNSSCQSPDILHQQSSVCEKRAQTTTGTDKRWTHGDTKMLIALIKEKWLLFEDTKTKKNIVWRNISQEMETQGVMVTKEQCSNRWKTLKAAYKRMKDHNNKSGTVIPFFIN